MIKFWYKYWIMITTGISICAFKTAADIIMTDAAAETLTAVSAVQSALSVLYTLLLTNFRYPSNCVLTNASYYDYIIVGGGTAGSVIANRLSYNSSYKVLLIEAGSYPPLETEMAGMFTPLPESVYDYATSSVNDGYSAQGLQNSCVSLTQGEMLGGSSSLDHMIYVQGDPHDFNNWASILNDSRWSYENVLEYFKKAEKLTDLELLASNYTDCHGTDGNIKIKRQVGEESHFILEAFEELGHKIVLDTTSLTSSLGATNPLFTIDDNLRQNNAYCYLGPAKSRSNLCVALKTTATKILIENGTAVGVLVTTSSGETFTLYANKEVIISAGAIHSPKLLMLSGIGPRSHLESLGIPVIVDLPVGQNLMDHLAAVLLYTIGKSNQTTTTNPHEFPVETTTLYATVNSSQTYPDYQTINLQFPADSGALMQLCTACFKYNNSICNKFGEANVGTKTLFVVHNLMMPKSNGSVALASTDAADEPIVHTGAYSNDDDLDLMAACLEDFNKVSTTDYFVNNNATLVDVGLCKGKTGAEFWRCYALAMSSTMWHYAGTCAMGSVVDSDLKVKSVESLRVIDASVMPTEVSGNIKAAITMIAEVGCDLILGLN